MATVGIIGGGISGLSAAHYLSKLSGDVIKKIVLYESSHRVGGWLQTSHFEDGSLFETGPRSVRPVGLAAQTTLSLVEDVGLTDQVISISRSHPAARNRMIYANGRLNLLPNGIPDLWKVKPPLTKSLLPKLLSEAWVPKSKEEDESVYEFFRRRMGDEVAKYYIDAMCHGIFAGNSRKLSIRSCFKDLWNMEQRSGSIVGGIIAGSFSKLTTSQAVPLGLLAKTAVAERWAVWSLKSGIEGLPRSIEESLRHDRRVEVRKNDPVSRIVFSSTASLAEMHTDNGKDTFDHIVSTIHAPRLAALLPSTLLSVAEDLKSISAVTVAVLNVEFDGQHLPLPAFGYLVPSSERSKILGVIFDSCLFKEQNRKDNVTRLTCMMGGAHFTENFGDPDTVKEQVLIDAALHALAKHLDIRETPTKLSLNIHKNCIPQYHVGHHAAVTRLREKIAQQNLPLSLIGSSYDGVGINDCAHGARLAAERIVDRLRLKTANRQL